MYSEDNKNRWLYKDVSIVKDDVMYIFFNLSKWI